MKRAARRENYGLLHMSAVNSFTASRRAVAYREAASTDKGDFVSMHKARRNFFIALLLGLVALSSVATAIPASATSETPQMSRMLGGLYR